MDDLINRQAAIEVCLRYNGVGWAWSKILDELKEIPSADVQPVQHGHWMLCENQNQDDVNNGNYLYVCSNCNHSDIHARTADVPYCWHCGARMDEVE